MKKFITLLLISSIVVAIPFIEGCKKGAEDPFISLLSRDARLKGTWKLISRSNTTITTTVTNTTNDVNSDNYTSTSVETDRETYSGNTLTMRNNYTVSESSFSFAQWDGDSWDVTVIENEDESGTDYNYSYTVEITIEKDNTYTATFTKTHISTTTYNLDAQGNLEIETQQLDPPLDTDTWTAEGNWFWIDSNDDKINIMTSGGPLNGKLLKLSNKELIIEEVSTSTNTETDYSDVNYSTHNDDDPAEFEEGIETSITTITVSVNDTETWEKQK